MLSGVYATKQSTLRLIVAFGWVFLFEYVQHSRAPGIFYCLARPLVGTEGGQEVFIQSWKTFLHQT
jgi:hypothetical protein